MTQQMLQCKPKLFEDNPCDYNLHQLIETYKTDSNIGVNNPEKEIERLFKKAAAENTETLKSGYVLGAAISAIAAVALFVGALDSKNVYFAYAAAAAVIAVGYMLEKKSKVEINPPVYLRQFKDGKIDPEARGSQKVFEMAKGYLIQEYHIS
jgi:hypothetical protein